MMKRVGRLFTVVVAIGALMALTASTASAQDDEAAAVQESINKFFENLGAIGSAEGAELDALVEETVGLLEGGNEETAAQLMGLGSLATGLTVEFQSVTVVDETNAEFVFDLLIDGNPTQVTDATGMAVKIDDTWKLSQDTWFALAALADTGDGEGGGDEGGDAEGGDAEGGDAEGGGDEEAAPTDEEAPDEELAQTGFTSGALIAIGLALVAGGAMVLSSSRRMNSLR